MFERVALVFAALTAATASPSPVPSPSTAPKPALKEIAAVRASASCGEIVTHANSAIAGALRNDAVVGQTISRLRTVDLDDGNSIHRRNGLQALGDYAKTLMQQSRSADNEVKRLRTLAEKSADPLQKKELKAFADELGGALWRQQKIARDLNGFLASVDFRDMMALDEDQRKANVAALGVEDPSIDQPAEWGRTDPQVRDSRLRDGSHGFAARQSTATAQAKAAASDFQSRVEAIATDEALAAGHASNGAFNACI